MSQFIEKLKYHEKTMLSEMAYGFSTTATSITQQELVDKIRGLTDKDIPVKMTSITDATYLEPGKTNRKGVTNNIGTVYKVSQGAGKLNANYAERKQEKLDQVAPGTTYTPSKTWGTHQSGSIVELNGKYYVQVMPEAPYESPRYVVKDAVGKFKESDKATVASVMKPASTTTKPDEVVTRKYSATSIVAIEINNESFVVSDADPDRKAVLDVVNATKAL